MFRLFGHVVTSWILSSRIRIISIFFGAWVALFAGHHLSNQNETKGKSSVIRTTLFRKLNLSPLIVKKSITKHQPGVLRIIRASNWHFCGTETADELLQVVAMFPFSVNSFASSQWLTLKLKPLLWQINADKWHLFPYLLSVFLYYFIIFAKGKFVENVFIMLCNYKVRWFFAFKEIKEVSFLPTYIYSLKVLSIILNKFNYFLDFWIPCRIN